MGSVKSLVMIITLVFAIFVAASPPTVEAKQLSVPSILMTTFGLDTTGDGCAIACCTRQYCTKPCSTQKCRCLDMGESCHALCKQCRCTSPSLLNANVQMLRTTH
ncbi:hypothetical protein Sjap_023830 [Stephania japonica]|uniref:Uncharacterized protein n=1 Tax=Stephania japonica TaxID=461633 RepID=A0AAP0EJM6_9MAGN